jgi:chromosome partitioning related protein ParA
MTDVVTVFSTKGGVGKTTVAVHLAALLADCGLLTLLVDADPQGSACKYFKTEGQAKRSLEEALIKRELNSEYISIVKDLPNLHILANGGTKPDEFIKLVNQSMKGMMSFDKILHSEFSQKYQFIIVDTQGISSPVHSAVGYASDYILCPIEPETLSAREFSAGTLPLIQDLLILREETNVARKLQVFTLFNKTDRTRNAKQVREYLQPILALNSQGFRHLKTSIPSMAVFKEANTAMQPVHLMPSARKEGGTSTGGMNIAEILHFFMWEMFPHLVDRDNGVFTMSNSLGDELNPEQIWEKGRNYFYPQAGKKED